MFVARKKEKYVPSSSLILIITWMFFDTWINNNKNTVRWWCYRSRLNVIDSTKISSWTLFILIFSGNFLFDQKIYMAFSTNSIGIHPHHPCTLGPVYLVACVFIHFLFNLCTSVCQAGLTVIFPSNCASSYSYTSLYRRFDWRINNFPNVR